MNELKRIILHIEGLTYNLNDLELGNCNKTYTILNAKDLLRHLDQRGIVSFTLIEPMPNSEPALIHRFDSKTKRFKDSAGDLWVDRCDIHGNDLHHFFKALV